MHHYHTELYHTNGNMRGLHLFFRNECLPIWIIIALYLSYPWCRNYWSGLFTISQFTVSVINTSYLVLFSAELDQITPLNLLPLPSLVTFDKKEQKLKCPLVKIQNETCLLFSEYIHNTLLYISHFLLTISCRHSKHTADKCTCALEFKKPFIFCFIILRCIQAKINEQFLNSPHPKIDNERCGVG